MRCVSAGENRRRRVLYGKSSGDRTSEFRENRGAEIWKEKRCRELQGTILHPWRQGESGRRKSDVTALPLREKSIDRKADR